MRVYEYMNANHTRKLQSAHPLDMYLGDVSVSCVPLHLLL